MSAQGAASPWLHTLFMFPPFLSRYVLVSNASQHYLEKCLLATGHFFRRETPFGFGQCRAAQSTLPFVPDKKKSFLLQCVFQKSTSRRTTSRDIGSTQEGLAQEWNCLKWSTKNLCGQESPTPLQSPHTASVPFIAQYVATRERFPGAVVAYLAISPKKSMCDVLGIITREYVFRPSCAIRRVAALLSCPRSWPARFREKRRPNNNSRPIRKNLRLPGELSRSF